MRTRLAAALLAAALLAGCSSSPKNVLGSRTIAVNDRVAAPDLKGELMSGAGAFELAQHKGDVVVVNFWASYCAPCRSESVDLEAVRSDTKTDGVTFIGINVHDQRDPANAFLTDIKPTYGSIFDPAGELALNFDVPPNSIPATLVVDRKGKIAAVIRGEITRELLEPVVRNLLAERA